MRPMHRAELIVRQYIGQVRKRLPGVRVVIRWHNYDQQLGAGFFLGQRRHGIKTWRWSRKREYAPDMALVRRIVAVLKHNKPDLRARARHAFERNKRRR
jgi:hypothetical protein